MILYHGTKIKFENFDFNKSTELGFCFTPDVSVARAYGEIIYTVDLNSSRILNLTSKVDAQEILEICPALEEAVEDEGSAPIDEILEDDFSIFTETVREAGLFTVSGREDTDNPKSFVRWHMLSAAKKAGYDCVLIEDYTDGDTHDTYIALNSEIIQKVTDNA
jgi:hypothetical protein